jgi:hypothetical protein
VALVLREEQVESLVMQEMRLVFQRQQVFLLEEEQLQTNLFLD